MTSVCRYDTRTGNIFHKGVIYFLDRVVIWFASVLIEGGCCRYRPGNWHCRFQAYPVTAGLCADVDDLCAVTLDMGCRQFGYFARLFSHECGAVLRDGDRGFVTGWRVELDAGARCGSGGSWCDGFAIGNVQEVIPGFTVKY